MCAEAFSLIYKEKENSFFRKHLLKRTEHFQIRCKCKWNTKLAFILIVITVTDNSRRVFDQLM